MFDYKEIYETKKAVNDRRNPNWGHPKRQTLEEVDTLREFLPTNHSSWHDLEARPPGVSFFRCS